ncbi:hypothetical protein NLI96_g3228 [Meripilus lineatus]|uniref:Uncharacterized protein n=1 Tax=Meripilus lineatus TaxID=2056292 RepID=A0AAD5V984_9APHY|nr:hypothetical protein NLI96_g3228 [Physisporinus lineatus]
MPSFDNIDDDVFVSSSSSRYLQAPASSVRKSPSRQTINGRRSSTNLRSSPSPLSLAQSLENEPDPSPNGKHSLAHELAFALMPEPSAGSRLLAEEFGIEYDEGAEGIDEQPHSHLDEHAVPAHHEDLSTNGFNGVIDGAVDFNGVSQDHSPYSFALDAPPPDIDPAFDGVASDTSPLASPKRTRLPDQDPMVVLAEDLEYTDKFLSHLRRLDGEPGSSPPASVSTQPTLEQLASDMIRRIDDTVRSREGQVRELLEYEREFRKLAGEPGGNAALGHLDELEDLIQGEVQTQETTHTRNPSQSLQDSRSHTLDAIQEDPLSSSQVLGNSTDWEAYLTRDHDRLNTFEDEDYESSSAYALSPLHKTTFGISNPPSIPPPPVISGPVTPSKLLPQFTHLRTFTTSVVTNLTTISEQIQVNSVSTGDAGRKIRALKNKLGGWKTEYDGVERSRLKIERWEAGLPDGDLTPNGLPSTPLKTRRVDGRKLAKDHELAFARAVEEASLKVQTIKAAAS